jgi:hypothetical protein
VAVFLPLRCAGGDRAGDSRLSSKFVPAPEFEIHPKRSAFPGCELYECRDPHPKGRGGGKIEDVGRWWEGVQGSGMLRKLLVVVVVIVLAAQDGSSRRWRRVGRTATRCGLNMRAGPGRVRAGDGPPGKLGLVFEACNADRSWLLGHNEDGSARGWVSALYVARWLQRSGCP